MKVFLFRPLDGPDFVEVYDGYVSHFFIIVGRETVRFAGFAGDKPLDAPDVPNDVSSIFTENGIVVC